MKAGFRFVVMMMGFIYPLLTYTQVSYNNYFSDKTLRFDFLAGGNKEEIRIYPQQMRECGVWPGSRTHLTDESGYGTYRYRVFDNETGTLLFSRGFANLFQEWQTTAEAREMERAYYQAIHFPFPLKKVKLSIESRNWSGDFVPVFETVIEPADYFILREKPEPKDLTPLIVSGNPDKCVDLVFMSEGYTNNEREKFLKDARDMTDYLFTVSPFSENRNRFNVSALWTPSEESGTDIPGNNIYRNTRFNSGFYTFDIDRYLTTSDMRSVYDVLSGVPWDNFFILVNSTQYGGGGFYNFLGIGTAGHYLSQKVMVHELGHSFAGLGDEYYTSEVAYENYYNTAIEPWEPNLTTLVDFGSKWKDLVSEDIPVPTPREDRFKGTTGVFEGGGYMSKGIFSPAMDCRMKSNGPDEFCAACRRAIQRIIDLYSE